jgi:hypothetical protein
MALSYTTGAGGNLLVAVRCAHKPCLDSGRGMMLCELSPDHHNVRVTALPSRQPGYDQVKKCQHCGGWNGVRYDYVKRAA